MSVIEEPRGRPGWRGLGVGVGLTCLVLVVLAVQASRQTADGEGPDRTCTETASLVGVPVMTVTEVGPVGAGEASLSAEPGAALLLVPPLVGAAGARLLARRLPRPP